MCFVCVKANLSVCLCVCFSVPYTWLQFSADLDLIWHVASLYSLRVSSLVLLQINRVMPLTNDCLTVPTNNPVSIPFRDAFSKNMHQSLSVSSFHQC